GREPVHPVGHGAAGHQRLAQQPAGGELVRVARAAQGREHVELPGLDVVRGEGVAASQVEVTGQPRDPGEHLDGCEVEVASFTTPRLDQVVHLVTHPAIVAQLKNLDV